MTLLDWLTGITVVFVLAGLLLFVTVIYTIATGKDRRYRAKYKRFLDQRRRVRDKLSDSKRFEE
jgi:hypothetical protein